MYQFLTPILFLRRERNINKIGINFSQTPGKSNIFIWAINKWEPFSKQKSILIAWYSLVSTIHTPAFYKNLLKHQANLMLIWAIYMWEFFSSETKTMALIEKQWF